MNKPEWVRMTRADVLNIHATIKDVSELIAFGEWLATQGLPGDTVIHFSGYYEVDITTKTDMEVGQTLFDELYGPKFDWPNIDKRKRQEWRGKNYGM